MYQSFGALFQIRSQWCDPPSLKTLACDSTKQGKKSFKKDETKIMRTSVAVKAGLGRYSGGVHGSNSSVGRRRRSPQKKLDEYDSRNPSEDNQIEAGHQEDTIVNQRLSVLEDMHHYYDAFEPGSGNGSAFETKTTETTEDVQAAQGISNSGSNGASTAVCIDEQAVEGTKTVGQFEDEKASRRRKGRELEDKEGGVPMLTMPTRLTEEGCHTADESLETQDLKEVSIFDTQVLTDKTELPLRKPKPKTSSLLLPRSPSDDLVVAGRAEGPLVVDLPTVSSPLSSGRIDPDLGLPHISTREDSERSVECMTVGLGQMEAHGVSEVVDQGASAFSTSEETDSDTMTESDRRGKEVEVVITDEVRQVLGFDSMNERIPQLTATDDASTGWVKSVHMAEAQFVAQCMAIAPDESGAAMEIEGAECVEEHQPLLTAMVEQAVNLGSIVAELPVSVVEQVVEILPNSVTEQVTIFSESVSQVADQVEQVASQVTDQVQQVAEQVSITAAQVTMQVTSPIVEFFGDEDYEDTDDEFEAFRTSNLPEFRGTAGLQNFSVLQEDSGVLQRVYNFYSYMLKKPLPQFAVGMFAAPILLSLSFTLLYLPEFEGLALDETARDFFQTEGGLQRHLEMSWRTVFQVFMFSLSLSTGLQPELAPLSPYTLVVANLNALVAQLIFVFLSGAVFARLSQPSQPVRCSKVALVCPSVARLRRKEYTTKVFLARYVLAGPQPCELVDVKVDLTYKYNTITRTGSYFRATQSLKLVRPEIAFMNHGMLVRHLIDETSPLYKRTPEMLRQEDAIFVLSVIGLERASMQSVFHVQHYCVCDDHVVWNAEFEDMILINKKNQRIVDHSKLSMWKSV